MGWMRANRRRLGAFALVALAIQLVISLGHFHPLIGTAAAEHATLALSDKALPAGDGLPPRHSDTNCDVCAVLHMAAAGQVAAAPTFALPHAFVIAQRVVIADAVLFSPRHFLAQSRAPPAV
jgi:hypothetical protein